MDVSESRRERTSESRRRSKSPFKPLAAEDSLFESHSNLSAVLVEPQDDGDWASFRRGSDFIQNQSNNSTHNSLASTVTVSSYGNSSHGNNSLSSHSTGNLSSPNPKKRNSSVNHRSPRRSPKPANKIQGRQIDSLPLSNAPTTDGQGLYYRPSKASLHANNLSKPSKKPQRIRARSKGPPVPRRKSYSDSQNTSQQEVSFSERGTRSSGKSSDAQDDMCVAHGRSKSCDKKKSKKSPSSSSRRVKKPSSVKGLETSKISESFHESWPQPEPPKQKDEERERRKLERQITQKNKRKSKSSKTKVTKKETKVVKEKSTDSMLLFLEDMATQSTNGSTAPPKPNPTRTIKKSNSARAFSHSRSPSRSSLGTTSAHGAPDDNPPNGSLKNRCQRRSSAPAKAIAAFHQYRKAINSSDFEDDLDKDLEDDEPSPSPELLPLPKEKVMLDVSELAALEIIRLGKDNSLKLDLFDLVKYLRQQQLQKGTIAR